MPDAAAGRCIGGFAALLRARLRRAGTDGDHRRLAGYSGLGKLGDSQDRRSQRAARARGEDPGKLLARRGVHRVASLATRWLFGAPRGSVGATHLASYLNEFVFRFNRRRSGSRGMVLYG